MLARGLILAVMALAVGGCCTTAPKPDHVGPLLSARPAGEHLARINEKAGLVETLRARGRVRIRWVDADGAKHDETADGVLILLQKSNGAGSVAEVVLFGSVASQDVFELGENAANYWMAVRVGEKVALVGSKLSPRDMTTHPALPFRAGKVPEVLGISPVGPGDLPLVTTNMDNVEVMVVRRTGQWPQVNRTMTYSRYGAGDLDTVRLYDADGIIEGSAILGNYRDVATAAADPDEPAKPDAPRVRLPFKIEIVYPSRQAQVNLDIESYELGVGLKDIAFKLPEFGKQGLKVETLRSRQPAPSTQPQ